MDCFTFFIIDLRPTAVHLLMPVNAVQRAIRPCAAAVAVPIGYTGAVTADVRRCSLRTGKAHCELDIRRFFFSERVINRWNQLDQESVDSGTVDSFKNNLERIRKSKIGFFMDRPVRYA